MTRSADLAVPVLAPPPHTPTSPSAQRLHIALERLPSAAYTWDDADADVTWDDTTPERVYDAAFIGGGFTDAVCDFIACTVDSGHVDDDGLFASGQAVVTLANPTGEYSTLDSAGRLVYWAPGRKVHIFADADGAPWWLFSGRVTAWDENADATVTVTAHDGFTQLAQEVLTEWVPGFNTQPASQRISSILSTWGYVGASSLETTDVRLGNPPTDRSPLEEIQTTAMSDGGFVFCDADGKLLYRGRTFTAGRTDQTVVRAFSDNVCDGPLNVWALEILVNDDGLASEVRLENFEEPAKVAVATAPTTVWDQPYYYTHPQLDLWTEQTDGNRLAADLLARHSNDAARFRFELYLHDPVQPALWRAGVDLRLGDKVNVIRTQPAAGDTDAILDVDTLATTIVHDISPDAWITTIETSRVVAYRRVELWDRTLWLWDDTPALWRY